MIANRREHKIAPIKQKQNPQIPPGTAFVKTTEWTNADAGVQVRSAENIGQPSNRGINCVLLA